MAELTMSGHGDIKAIANMIREEVQAAGMTNQLVGSSVRVINDVTSILLVFEKYYMRASNRASLSVMLTGDSDGAVHVDAVGAGGGQGVLISFSWGAEENFIQKLQTILLRHGFYH